MDRSTRCAPEVRERAFEAKRDEVAVALDFLLTGVLASSSAAATARSSWTGPDTAVTLPSPEITTPTSGSTLAGSSATFTWSANGNAVTEWYLQVGTTPGGVELFSSSLAPGVTSQQVTGLPTDGTVYVRLWWCDGQWNVADASYFRTVPVLYLSPDICRVLLSGLLSPLRPQHLFSISAAA